MKKMAKITLRITLVGVLSGLCYVSLFLFNFSQGNIQWGVTFSKPFAEKLGLDWREAYTAVLDDLGVRQVRVNTYWDGIERQEGIYDWNDYDWQITEAAKRGASVVLIIGRRTARWPECHDPSWIRSLTEEQKREKVLAILKKEVEHFAKYDNIGMWQVENEPLLTLFGECTGISREFLEREVAIVRTLDARPIMVTDSGELSTWLHTGSAGEDVLGTTLYKRVWNPYIGHVSYVIPPVYYTARAWLLEKFYGTRVIISELQGEPWGAQQKELDKLTLAEQFTSFDLRRFQKTLAFAPKTGFTEGYLWGVEWWYWLKTTQNNPAFWNEAKRLF